MHARAFRPRQRHERSPALPPVKALSEAGSGRLCRTRPSNRGRQPYEESEEGNHDPRGAVIDSGVGCEHQQRRQATTNPPLPAIQLVEHPSCKNDSWRWHSRSMQHPAHWSSRTCARSAADPNAPGSESKAARSELLTFESDGIDDPGLHQLEVGPLRKGRSKRADE